MNQIQRIIYVPTLRCNCACKHCGQSRYFKEEECDPELIRRRILESTCFSGQFSITGGEPFLKKGLPVELAKTLQGGGDILCDITTNGTYVDAVKAFVDQVDDVSRLLFSVSIDGLPETHDAIRRNPRAFDLALETIKYLQSRSVPVKVNVVVQKDNFGDLERFPGYLRKRTGQDVSISWIPVISEVNGKPEFPFSDDEVKSISSLFREETDQAYLRTRGRLKISGCHAGEKTVVISPSGKVYSCLTGFSYKDLNRRESFLIGDLKEKSLDEIAEIMAKNDAAYRKEVQSCEGCWNPCEVGNEIQYWGLSIPDLEQALKESENMSEIPKKVEVDIEEIMRGIRREIQMGEDLKNLPAFEDIPIRGEQPAAGHPTEEESANWQEFYESLEYANKNYEVPYYWEMGPRGLKTFIKRVVRKLNKCLIPPILEKQITLNAMFVRCHNAFRCFAEQVHRRLSGYDESMRQMREGNKELSGMLRRVSAQDEEHVQELRRLAAQSNEISGKIQRFTTEVGIQDERLNELAARSEDILQRLDALQEQLREKEDAQHTQLLSDVLNQRLDKIEQCQAETEQRQVAQNERSDRMERRITSLDRQSDAFSASAAKTLLAYKEQEGLPVFYTPPVREKEQNGESTYTVLDYSKFQNNFRGTRATISERQEMYLPYFRDSKGPVLDIGCGRGEFLRLMKDNKIPAFGVDMYPEYVVEGELNGLDVRNGDGVVFLRDTDMQFGGIFACQVIEHISFTQLQELCVAAYEKLLPGGHLILETPNPMCVSMFTQSFYIDPTHNKPVHPLLLEYLLREVGFQDVQTVFTQTSKVDFSLPQIEGDGIRNLDEVNRAISRVSELLYGSLDYAVIAKK